jgi:formylglycine-generating enzyme required for sulfatase activity
VSWYECVAYCRWLSTESGEMYRLPTEAEWEKGARGRDGRQYPWGNRFEASRLNAKEGEQVVWATTPVGIYPAGVSPFGAFDCAGNVWEWCATKAYGRLLGLKFKSYPYDVAEDEWGEDYLAEGEVRVLRGGSWYFRQDIGQDIARCAFRDGNFLYNWLDLIGFRLVSPI